MDEEMGAVLRLKKPYRFEGTEYSEIDLSGLDELTVKDAIDAQNAMLSTEGRDLANACETTTEFACAVAAKATGKPVEFFTLLPIGVSRRVMAAVIQGMNADIDEKSHVVRFEKPYVFENETFEQVDLSGIGDLTGLDEMRAEHRMARAGVQMAAPQFNYLYICCVAAMATGLKEEFFTGLPLREALRLKVAVNHKDFFE